MIFVISFDILYWLVVKLLVENMLRTEMLGRFRIDQDMFTILIP